MKINSAGIFIFAWHYSKITYICTPNFASLAQLVEQFIRNE